MVPFSKKQHNLNVKYNGKCNALFQENLNISCNYIWNEQKALKDFMLSHINKKLNWHNVENFKSMGMENVMYINVI